MGHVKGNSRGLICAGGGLRELMMRAIAFGLLIAATAWLPAYAAEPDGPINLIDQTEAVRIAVQGLLADKPGDTSMRKAQKNALIEYYLVPDQPMLWVNDNGLTDRAKLVMAEIGKADDYGLTAADYKLPDASGYNATDPKANDWLADAEVKVSYAVLDYVKDARGGRLEPLKVSKNLDPSLALPNSSEVLEFDRHSLRPRRLSQKLPARPAAIRGAQAKAARAPRRQGRGAEARRGDDSPGPGAEIRHRGPAGRVVAPAARPPRRIEPEPLR